MSDYLPGDVLSEILARLKAEDLVRCTAVCKKWYVLIRSPSFISLHLKQSLEDKDRNYLLVGIRKSTEDYYLCAEGTCHEPKKFTVPLYSLFKLYFRIVSCCNGLICLFNDLGFSTHKMILIWNLVINKAIHIPFPDVSFGQFSPCAVGFGFDSVTNDHKFIKITYPPLRSSDTPTVQVYSLNKEVWRNLGSDKAPTHRVFNGSQQAYVREAVHWLAGSACNRQNLILVFDMKDDKFREMLVPESVRSLQICGYEMHLHAYQESISLFHHYCYDEGSFCDIWVMREYGVQESWSRQLKIDVQKEVLGREVFGKAIGMTSNGELVFTSREGKLLSYDNEKMLVSDLKIKGLGNFFLICYIYVGAYTDSLVLLDKGEDLHVIASRMELAKTVKKDKASWLIASDADSILDPCTCEVKTSLLRGTRGNSSQIHRTKCHEKVVIS